MWRKYIVASLLMVVSLSIVPCANPNSDNDNSGETFQVKYYEYFGNDEQSYTYTEETISQETMSEDSVELIKDKYGVTVDGMWYEEERICVDIVSRTHPFLSFDEDDLTGAIFTRSIVQTFLSYPNVTEVELLFNGTRNVWGRHFTFGVFNSSGVLIEPQYDEKIISGESFPAQYYDYYNNNEETYTYTKETISRENISEDSIKLIKEKYDVILNKVWYEGERICVDIRKTSPFLFDGGSHMAFTLTCSFVHTFLSYPDVTEVELLVNGRKNVWGNHFAFGVYNSSKMLTEPSSDTQDFIDSIK